MFVLTEFKDVVKIPPSKFNLNIKDAITDELNRKLSNKVFINVGLCIALYDILDIKDSYIFPGDDGASHTVVIFRFVVFRPFVEEIIVGKIRNCSLEGVQVSLEYFDDILIPPNKLQQKSRFDQMEQVWIWEYVDVESGAKTDLFLDKDELIRFRVVQEVFVEDVPTKPAISADGIEVPETSFTPYSLIGGIDEPGLGVLSWWG
ncbi:hypothetical protein HCN44_006522 [Aphidius gifuensis]|uniref:DNA-directed RNA polymerase III subunit RPC8 n=1 Tax=Aphidius gifuensis TaxID=684658 RepID=A0A834XXN4_APHGI|nr:DNA-directed RNA polymerase III subunit RPC8 [Aphidius gifuensis]KAF7995415.1 hypothetical protein HCN44_006522 [Aphidius gifuensis]